ncbi:retrovirus-related pol polyprotein from transposon TNT 1-94 [Tanacetum coccineum]
MQQPMSNPEDILDPTTAINMTLVLMAKAFKLNYSTPTNNNQRISSNPRNRQIAQPIQNLRVQNVGNQNGLIVVPGIAPLIAHQNANYNGNGNVVAARAEGNVNRNNGNQIMCYNYRGLGHYARNCTVRPMRRGVAYLQLLIAQKEKAGIQLQAEEFDLMVAVGDIDVIEDVNANYVLMANLQQASTSGVDNTSKTRRPQPRSNTKNDRVPSASKSNGLKNKEAKVEEHHRNLLLSNNKRPICVDLLKGNRTTNIYTINLYEMASASPICLIAPATSTKSWLWHQRLSHFNFDTINDLAKNDLVTSLPKFKYHKEHLCPSCEQGKGKKASHPPKPILNSKQRLHLLHMDLCGPMRVESINGKWAFCYPKNDREDIGKLGAKGDIGFFIGYSTNSCAYRVYNRRTKKIMETMNVTFNELSAMAFEQRTMYDDYIGGQPSATPRTTPATPAPQVLQTPMASTITADIAPTPTNSSSQDADIPNTLHDVDELQQPQYVHP